MESDSTMDGAALMDESEEAEQTEEQTWEVVKDFIVGDHTPPPAADLPALDDSEARWTSRE